MSTKYWRVGWRICTVAAPFTFLSGGYCADFDCPYTSDGDPGDITTCLTILANAWFPKLQAVLPTHSLLRVMSLSERTVSDGYVTQYNLPFPTGPLTGYWGNRLDFFLPPQNVLIIKKRSPGVLPRDKGRFAHAPIPSAIIEGLMKGSILTTDAGVVAFADQFKTPIVVGGVTFTPCVKHKAGGHEWEPVDEVEVQQAICVNRRRRITLAT